MNPMSWAPEKYYWLPFAVYLISFDDTGTRLENMVPT